MLEPVNFKIVEHTKTAFNKDDMHRLLCKDKSAKVIGWEYAEEGHLFNGTAYWKYQAVKYAGRLYIIEFYPHKNDDDYDVVTKEINY